MRYRTPSGDVILRHAPTGTRRPGAGGRSGRLRVVAAVLAAIAAVAVVAVAVGAALSSAGPGGTAHGTPVIAGPSASASHTEPRTEPGSAPHTEPSTEAHTEPGVAAARERVSGFVAALNRADFPSANRYLCASMAGSYGPASLDGVVSGSLGVGGVAVRGDTGSAVVTYRLTGGSDTGRTLFGLVVERGVWTVCRPQ